MVASRTAVYRCGAGNGVPPLVPHGGHRERRPTGTQDSHQHRGGEARRPAGTEDSSPGERPGILAEPGPQRSDRTVPRSAVKALPILGLRVLAGS